MIAGMERRQFITLLGGAAAAWPLASSAQQPARLPTIGYLGATTPSTESQRVAALVQRLRELGWIKSRNLTIEYRYAEGRSERTRDEVRMIHSLTWFGSSMFRQILSH